MFPMKKPLILLLAGALCLTACSGARSAPASNAASAAPVSQVSSSAVQKPSAAPSAAGETAPDPKPAPFQWEVGAPEDHGMDPDVLQALHAALPGSGIYAMVTVKDGVIIDEYYEEGYNEDSLFQVHSASKSVTGALVGIALEEGLIDSIDDPISKYLPQALEQADPRKAQITIRDLLTQTSGLEWYEWGSGPSNWQEFRSAENWVDYILGRRLLYEPGTLFNYSTGNTHLLSAILQEVTGMSQEAYCRSRLFDPLGISGEAHWGTDPQGVVDGGNGLVISARDAARFGQLFLDGGAWQGEQLVPAAWVAESTTAQNNGAGDATGSYGYQWWMRSFTTGGYNTYATPYPTASYDVYFAFGHGGNFIHVIPELHMVNVIVSSCPSSYDPRPYFVDYVLNAYMGG